jgi:L-asparaginase II
MNASVVEVWRGGMAESRHHVAVAVVDAEGRLRARARDAGMAVFARSGVKPLQALPLVEDGVAERFGLTAAELAIACASHSGEARHVEAARSLLKKAGVDESALACGVHPPFDAASARALRQRGDAPARIHNNCSGKHAGMLALSRAHGWPIEGYHEAGHPAQQRMTTELARWSGVAASDLTLAVDGCGVVTFALPLHRLAAAFARFGRAARCRDEGPARITEAMTVHPELVGGTERLCTELMRVTAGRLLAKVGAEGVYCAGVPGAELGIALKVEDGARRAAEPALLAVLGGLGLITEAEAAELERFARPAVLNTRGEVVGMVRAHIELEAARG